ncbi:MAG: tRNA glutamyl-Q(34) synthetase GluQRS [Planctomycetota bacterium]
MIRTTRLAPSPTGALHLGNARTFLINWAMARQAGWRILLRIEDLDGPRIKAGAAELAIDVLRWLGLDWDEGPLYQSHDLTPYEQALATLADAGEAYPCRCTRSQIAAAALSAPHAADHDLRYPGTCRPAERRPMEFGTVDKGNTAWRLRAPNVEAQFEDEFVGPYRHNLQQSVGDFVIATKAGLPSYQLAVVVDDARQGVTDVVRGDDLLLSTPRQQLLYERLELGEPPRRYHLPMVIGEDGRRLAKRHGDTRVDHYRQRGVAPERVLGLLAEWCGLGQREPITAETFLQQFDLAKLPREEIVFTAADDRWLMGG